MSLPEHRPMTGRFLRLAAAMALAGLTAGCFQPLYGQRSVTSTGSVGDALRHVQIDPINAPNGSPEARLAVEVRNNLIFDTTGGSGQPSPTHRLTVQLVSLRQQVIVDIATARPDVENYGINATYTLTEIASGKSVVTGQTFARVSFDIPGQEQRFARIRGLRDAENRTAKMIADNIRSRLASYFVAGS
jgi:LPS-assembly lipoprotein